MLECACITLGMTSCHWRYDGSHDAQMRGARVRRPCGATNSPAPSLARIGACPAASSPICTVISARRGRRRWCRFRCQRSCGRVGKNVPKLPPAHDAARFCLLCDCRSPFEKSQFLPVKNVTARPVDMTLPWHHCQTLGEGEGPAGAYIATGVQPHRHPHRQTEARAAGRLTPLRALVR